MEKQQETTQKVEQLEKEVWSIIKSTLPALKKEILDTIGDVDTSALEQRIEALEKKPDNSGRVVEVIYDMNSADASVNQGFTTGVPGGKEIYWKGEYDFLRFYASLGGMLGYLEVPVNNRPRHDIVLSAMSASGTTLHYMKAILYNEYKRINVGSSYTYMLDEEDGTTSFVSGYNSTYYITRVEGVKGL